MTAWFYMSFADPKRAVGEQFLGGCYVPGETIPEALTFSHVHGINPGGEVALVGPIPEAKIDEYVAPGDRERLLTREELETAGPSA